MNGDTITLVSTTDTQEQVNSALGMKAEAVVEAPAEKETAPAEEEVAQVAAPEEVEEVAEVDEPTPQSLGGKKKASLQRRIDELVDERNKAVGSSASKDAELAALRARLSELAVQVTAPKAAVPDTPTESTPPAKPKVEDFPDYEAYVEAVSDWKATARAEEIVEKKLKAAREDAQKTVQQQARSQVLEKHFERVEAAKSRYDDFDAVVMQDGVPITNVIRDGIFTSDVGPDVAYYLAQHATERDALVKLGDTPAAVRAFGRLEAKVERWMDERKVKVEEKVAAPVEEKPKAAPKAAAKPVTAAPDPISPVGSGVVASTVPLDQMDYQSYKAARMAQERKARGLE